MEKSKKSILFIFLTILIDCIGIGIIIPTLPALIQGLSGESISIAASYGGWLNFSYAIMAFVFSPVLGGLSDRFGRRPILLISLLGLGLDYLFLAFAPTIFWLFIGRIIAGVCGASFTTASAYIADVSSNENRAKNFGMIGAAFGLGFIIGPLLGSVFGSFGTRIPFIAAAGFSLLNFLFGYFILPESLDKDHRRAFSWKRANPFGSLIQLAKHKAVINLIIVLFIINVAGQAMPTIWTFFCIERFAWDEKMIGLSLAFVGVAISIVQGGLIGVASKRLGVKKSVFIGLGFYVLGFFLFSLANKSWMMFAFMIPYALGGIAVPNIQSILSSRVGANEQGELQGGLTSLISLTAVIGPIIMSSSFTFFTRNPESLYFPGISFFIGGILALLSLIISYSVLKKIKL
ncbi:TCR/Tet family MFS transporter [Aurantibacillus circumpalustris]|uniref:TCR/Tet family MFS transporter n=1 Tax=Aurantibacillus circumpalustris TaxID=3036359 RepID=UPI00295C31F4|nr:TCR/Tet family MFS transporter [Aurantibacillus circumpalustris]